MESKSMNVKNIQPAALEPTQGMIPTTPTIVGRQRELALAFHHYEAAKHGQTSVVLVSGEPGIGKTCLLDEMARRASHDGAVVLRGGSSECEGMPPFLPFLEALGSYIQHTPRDQLREQIDPVSPLLARLLPEVTVRLGTQPEPCIFSAEQARYRFYEAVGTFLETIGAPRALVLMLDDLHWADSASLDLLCHVARRHVDAHLLLLGAYRDCEIDQCSVLAHAITELSRQRVLTAVALSPLSTEEIEVLAESQLGGSLAPSTSLLLSRQCEGNPFFAEELLRCWIEGEALIQENQQWIVVESLVHTLPPSIVGALRQRFARLSAVTIDHLRVAAIIGRTFDLSLLATVLEEEVEVVEERILDAARARLICLEQSERFTFSHDKIRECLYTEVSTSRRRRLHERIGHVLMVRYEQEHIPNLTHLAELAFHFVHSSDRARGIHYSLLASRLAMQTAAFKEAIKYYRTTLELLDLDDERRDSILLEMRKAASLADKGREAEKLCEAAACKPTGSSPLPANLTQREAEVLKLVAQGKSNRQIARALGLTEKTVTNHLTHILHKTNCENRAAATAFAFRHGLT
jgi:predicted ATPase